MEKWGQDKEGAACMVKHLFWQRKINWLTDGLFINRSKIKVTYFDELNKEQDLRCKIKDGRLQIFDEAKTSNIDANPKIHGQPVWDKGPRYICIAGHNKTFNPIQAVNEKFKDLTSLEKLGFAELIQVGVRWERNQGEKRSEDLLKWILIAIGIQLLVIVGLALLSIDVIEGITKTLGTNTEILNQIKIIVEG